MNTFEDYLKEIHDKQYRGTADNAPDDYENWECNLLLHEFMQYADQYKNIRLQEIDQEINELVNDHDGFR